MPDPDPRLTLRLDGPKITADQFARAVTHFCDLLDEVSEEITGSPKAVRWIVTLASGSGIIRARPEAVPMVNGPRVRVSGLVRGISRGVGILERRAQRAKHFKDPAMRILRDLAAVPDGYDVRSIRIQAEETDVAISDKTAQHVNHLLGEDVEEYGTVEGRLQTLSERNRPHFAVYDPLTDHPIRCYVRAQQIEQAWKAFGWRVSASGLIRYRKDGRAVSIKVETLYAFPPDDALPTAADVYGILDTIQ